MRKHPFGIPSSPAPRLDKDGRLVLQTEKDELLVLDQISRQPSWKEKQCQSLSRMGGSLLLTTEEYD